MPSSDWYVSTGGHLGEVWVPDVSTGTNLPVTALAPDDAETVWAAFYDVIIVYRHRQWQRLITCTHILANDQPIHAMCFWQDKLWLAGNGLWFYHNEVLQRATSLPEDYVVAIYRDTQHRLVVGFRQSGIWYSTDGQYWTNIIYPQHFNQLHALESDIRGDIWITVQGTTPYPTSSKPIKALSTIYTNRLWTTAQITIWFYNFSENTWIENCIIPEPTRVITMAIDEHRGVWIGTEGDGIWHKTDISWSHITRSSRRIYCGLPSNSVIDLYIDTDTRLWSVHLRDIELGICEYGQWRSAFTAMPIIDANTQPLVWVPQHTTAAYYQPEYERIWLGTGGGEIGWIDVSAEKQLVIPKTIVTYHSMRVNIV